MPMTVKIVLIVVPNMIASNPNMCTLPQSPRPASPHCCPRRAFFR